MKKPITLLLFIAATIFTLTAQNIRVGVFKGNGAAETCVVEAKAACEIDSSLSVRIIQSADIAGGGLNDVDVLVIPGGSGSREYQNLGTVNREAIRRFVQAGGGLVGICAGAYLTSDTPDYSCLQMSGGKAIDIEHDNRGRGVAKVTLSIEGKHLFPEVANKDTLYIMYYEGPVIVPAEIPERYQTLATMQSDVHVEGNAPTNMTNNRPFFYLTPFGKGKVFSSIGHPEATPGMQWMLTRMVHAVYTGKNQRTSLPSQFIRPNLYNREILMTESIREKETQVFKTLLQGSTQEKVEAIRWIANVLSWDGKRWLQGTLYDTDIQIRKAGIEAVRKCMYRYYLPDLRTILHNETNGELKRLIERTIQELE